MKIIQLFIFSFAFKCTTGQVTLLTGRSNSKTNFIQPINAGIRNVAVNTIESYIAADVNRKLYSAIFFTYKQKKYPFPASDYGYFLKVKPLSFQQAEINRRFQSTSSSDRLNAIANITGSVLNTFLRQYH